MRPSAVFIHVCNCGEVTSPYSKQLVMHWQKSTVVPLLVRMATASGVWLSACALTIQVISLCTDHTPCPSIGNWNVWHLVVSMGTLWQCPTLKALSSSQPVCIHAYAILFVATVLVSELSYSKNICLLLLPQSWCFSQLDSVLQYY